MTQTIFQQALRFIGLVLLQVLLLDRMDYFGFMCPYIYLLFLLQLPLKTNYNLLMLLGFMLGLCVDMFENTLGLHTSACVLVAFVRPYWLEQFLRHREFPQRPLSAHLLGWPVYVRYTAGLVLLHHLLLFFLEAVSFSGIGFTLFKALANTAVSLLLLYGYELIRRKS